MGFKLRIIFTIIFGMVLTTPAYAEGGYLGYGKVQVMQNAYYSWILRATGPNANPDSCSKPYTILPVDHPQRAEIFSLILASYVAGKTVNIAVKGCDVNGYKKFNFVYSAWGND